MAHDLPKAYDPSEIEQRWADYWVREKLFDVATPTTTPAPPSFSLLLPPPNVTGRLHMGHMLNHTEMDIIIRWRRMQGLLTVWIPGTDHAGIATQMMVERQLASEGKNRRDLGREKFLERVWQWKEQYGGAITAQMRRIGDSVDWSREYFTMNDALSRAVREAFVRFWEEGLIYRGKYIVNWCPRCSTALSDLEVVHEETQGKLWEIRYPVIGTDEYITVATTRPETMLGDTAVAVNPLDERYTHLHGKKIKLPLVGREIPLILDELAQPEFGTGAVKVTPAHDPNDFLAGQRHGLPQVTVMDEHARMNEEAGKYAGLDRYEAREKIVADLEAQGFLVGTKDYVVPLGKCDRCKTIVEPRLSEQWFLAVNKETNDGRPSLAQVARDVVYDGRIRFTPDNYRHIYLQWMENIHDWCISRQLWWGHRIPAWHCADCNQPTVARETPAKCAHCGSTNIEQDTDVLDTWFSSALLPFTSLGWPEKTRDLDVFYPTSLLLTAFDILFFWVARMIMMGCHFMADHPQGIVPFKEVYIHSLVRDADRQKMSKTKGNVVDPIEVLEKFGTDAVRFTLASMAAPGTDIAFSESRTESYRAFANKIWNASRFIFMNVDQAQEKGVWSLAELKPTTGAGLAGFTSATLEDRWILSRFNRVAQQVSEALTEYRFHEAAHVVYHFFWGEFCDWYIELMKPRLASENREEARTAFNNLALVFEGALRLLSPFMPFITEEIWHAVFDGRPPLKSIALAQYPTVDHAQLSDEAERDMAILQDLIVAVRNIRAEIKVAPKETLDIAIHCDASIRKLFEENAAAITRLANVGTFTFVDHSLAKETNARSTARFDVRVIYEQKIDVAAERERLNKEIEKLAAEQERGQKQLGNEGFLAKAPAKVVEGLRTRQEEVKALLSKAAAALSALEGK
ncbi:MAG TPA: valine--tRNA ligase [candidate division Zixibacteria bacterium]|nr:valine--tRNA ligase [candidate division Zixibacteria bacterium]